MIFAASWAISARLYGLVQRFAPSNVVIRRVHIRTGIKWGPLVGLAGVVVYGLLMAVAGTVVRGGGPGWVNVFFIVGFWNTVRFAVLVPVSVVRLLRVRHQETVLLREWQRAERAGSTPAGTGRVAAAVAAGQA